MQAVHRHRQRAIALLNAILAYAGIVVVLNSSNYFRLVILILPQTATQSGVVGNVIFVIPGR